MIDSRINNNPANQNGDLYSLRWVYKPREKVKIDYDYYLPFAAYKPEGFAISKERPPYPMFTGITIKDKWARQVILSVDWNKYVSKNIATYTLSMTDFHRGFNDNV